MLNTLLCAKPCINASCPARVHQLPRKAGSSCSRAPRTPRHSLHIGTWTIPQQQKKKHPMDHSSIAHKEDVKGQVKLVVRFWKAGSADFLSLPLQSTIDFAKSLAMLELELTTTSS